MKYFSMFSGIGGFEYGIEKAFQGRRRENTSSKRNKPMPGIGDREGRWYEQPPTCIGYSEIDKFAIQIYRKHFPGHRNFGDATAINTDKIPEFDLLVGGFPCQAFSVAGKRLGFSDTRGTLFFEIARILRDKRPRYFLLENVKGLVGHANGKTFQAILGILTDIGYLVQWQVLNSKNFGVPQNRERVFITGYSREKCPGEILYLQKGYGENKKAKHGKDYSGTISTKNQSGQLQIDHGTTFIANAIDGNYYKGMDKRDGIYDKNSPCLRKTTNNNVVVLSRDHGYNKGGTKELPNVRESAQNDGNELIEITKYPSQDLRVYDSKGLSKTLSNGGGQGAKTGLYMINLHQKRTGKYGDGEKSIDDSSFTLDSACGRDLAIANCLTPDAYLAKGERKRDENGKAVLTSMHERRIRRLTPIECERLQGFPDNWTKYGINEKGNQIEISDTQRYKCLGNAVTTNVIEHIITNCFLKGAT